MITEFLIAIVTGVLNFILLFLPSMNSIPTGLETAMDSIAGPLGSINTFFPVDTFLTVVSLGFTIELALFGFRVAEWLFSKISPTGQVYLYNGKK